MRDGAKFNGYTSDDFTAFYEVLHRSKLELALRAESSRMRSATFVDADVKEEVGRVQAELNNESKDPFDTLRREVKATAFRAHPYRNPISGWRTDLENIAVSDVKAFYDRYYQPDNATLVLVGDFQPQDATTLINKYFAGIAKSNNSPSNPRLFEPAQTAERQILMHGKGSRDLALIGYHACEYASNDAPAMVVFENLLNAHLNGKLHKDLVEPKICAAAHAEFELKRDPSLFSVYLTAGQGVSAQYAVEKWDSLIAQLKLHPITEAELNRSRNLAEYALLSDRDGPYKLSFQLGLCDSLQSLQSAYNWNARIRAVSTADIQRIAKHYFSTESRVVGTFVTPGSGTSKPKAEPEAASHSETEKSEKTSPSSAETGTSKDAAKERSIASEKDKKSKDKNDKGNDKGTDKSGKKSNNSDDTSKSKSAKSSKKTASESSSKKTTKRSSRKHKNAPKTKAAHTALLEDTQQNALSERMTFSAPKTYAYRTMSGGPINFVPTVFTVKPIGDPNTIKITSRTSRTALTTMSDYSVGPQDQSDPLKQCDTIDQAAPSASGQEQVVTPTKPVTIKSRRADPDKPSAPATDKPASPGGAFHRIKLPPFLSKLGQDPSKTDSPSSEPKNSDTKDTVSTSSDSKTTDSDSKSTDNSVQNNVKPAASKNAAATPSIDTFKFTAPSTSQSASSGDSGVNKDTPTPSTSQNTTKQSQLDVTTSSGDSNNNNNNNNNAGATNGGAATTSASKPKPTVDGSVNTIAPAASSSVETKTGSSFTPSSSTPTTTTTGTSTDANPATNASSNRDAIGSSTNALISPSATTTISTPTANTTKNSAQNASIGLTNIIPPATATRVAGSTAINRSLPIAEHKLKNGVRVVAYTSRMSPIVQVSGWMQSGEIYEQPAKRGVSTLLTACFNNGSSKSTRAQLALQQEDMGLPPDAMLHFANTQQAIVFNTRCLSKDLSKQLNRISDVIRDPGLKEEDVERARAEAQAHLKHLDDSLAERVERTLTRSLLAPTSAYFPEDIAKTSKSVGNLNADDLKEFAMQHIAPEGCTIVLSGDVDIDVASKLVEQALGNWNHSGSYKNSPAPEVQASVRKILKSYVPVHDTKSGYISLGRLIPMRMNDPRYSYGHARRLCFHDASVCIESRSSV